MKFQALFLIAIVLPCVFGFSFFGKSSDKKVYDKEALNVLADDHCFPYTTCETCIAQKYCGWCSTPVIGGNGAQCAGFSPTNGSSPFICIGTYQTTTCIPPITVNSASTGQSSSSSGGGSSGDSSTGSGSSGTTTPTSTTGVQPVPVVQGSWRGLQVNNGYIPGEFDVDFAEDNVTIKGPNGFIVVGTILSSPTEMDIVVTQSTKGWDGKTLFGSYEQDFGPATLFLTWALAPVGAKAPPTWGSAMKDTTALVFALEQPKQFLWAN